MAEDIILVEGTKEEKYLNLLPQVEGLLYGESDSIAALANASAVLKSAMAFFWVGFYMVKKDQLVLGPFQGPPACTRIIKGKGVCGTSWENNETILVDDVDQFPGHIACSSASKSEVVIPVRNKLNEVIGVLDVDSDRLNDFDQIDVQYLEKIVSIIETTLREAKD